MSKFEKIKKMSKQTGTNKQSTEIEQIQLILDMWYVSYSNEMELFVAVTNARTVMSGEMIGQIKNLGFEIESVYNDSEITRVYFVKRKQL